MFFILAIIIALLESTIFRGIDILPVLVIFRGLRKGPFVGLLTGAGIGLIAEVFSSGPLGIDLILYSITGLFSGILSDRFYYRKDLLSEMIFLFLGLGLFYFLSLIFIGRDIISYRPIIITILFLAVFSPLAFRLIER